MKNIKIKIFLILCIVVLLSSCKRNNSIYKLHPPYKYQVEYCGNKIILSKISNTGETTSTIWKKRNGEYFDENNRLQMSLKDTSYRYYQKVHNVRHVKTSTWIRPENDSLYSATTKYIWNNCYDELKFVVYYDKSYRIKKIQVGGLYEYRNK